MNKLDVYSCEKLCLLTTRTVVFVWRRAEGSVCLCTRCVVLYCVVCCCVCASVCVCVRKETQTVARKESWCEQQERDRELVTLFESHCTWGIIVPYIVPCDWEEETQTEPKMRRSHWKNLCGFHTVKTEINLKKPDTKISLGFTAVEENHVLFYSNWC